MKNIFQEAATTLDVPSVQEWKENNGKVVGYTCSFMPVEPYYAAGILPLRLRGINASGMEIADSYYGPFVCSFPKALLQAAGTGKYAFLDGVVLSNGCDTLRRLDDCWRKMGQDIKGSLPTWHYYLDVPHKPDGHAFDWYVNQIRKMMAAIEKQFDVTITDEGLGHAIKEQNKVRRLLWKLEELRRKDILKVTGSEAYAAIIAGTVMPRDIYAGHLADLLEEIQNRTVDVALNRKKLFLSGSVCDDSGLINLIEQSDAVVAGENLCFGVRDDGDIVSETGDPVAALAAKYLSGSVCPRMMGWYQSRSAGIMNRIKSVHADGVILQNIRFCDLHGSENGLFEGDLEKNALPSLRIEREYGPLTESGRLRMRVDAFIEQLSSGNKTK
ncbi:MAG: 2-hydroxyacyl-CoA dehydratase [Desulfobacteraceae bacterium]|nr:2-hydroxyacyl-CoA dehydratase [Desulfobacteraceae bacterium]